MNNDRYGLRGRRLCTLAFASAVLLSGCHSQILIKRDSPQFRDTTGQWTQAIAERGKNGDWLVIRGYHDADNVVAVATNARLSHVAIFDADRGEVIEAVAPVVRVIPLAKLIAGSHRVVLLRPTGWSPASGAAAVARARSKVGVPYDFLGVIGIPSKKKFYCSELAAWSVGLKVDRHGAHRVLVPKDMLKHGRVVLDTKERRRR